MRVLRAHTETVFSTSFSPSGRHLASAGWDKLLVIWETEVSLPISSVFLPTLAVADAQPSSSFDLQTGKPVRHRAGEAGIFEVEWSKNAGVIAVCQSDKAVVLVDVKELE